MHFYMGHHINNTTKVIKYFTDVSQYMHLIKYKHRKDKDTRRYNLLGASPFGSFHFLQQETEKD